MKQVNRKTGKLAAIIVLMFVFFSCTTMRTMVIEIPQQSNKELPPNIQSLTLVNRTVDDSYTDLQADSLQRIFYKAQFNLDTIVYDLQSVDTTLQALGELLFESGRYDYVIPENRFLPFQRNAFLTAPMPWTEVKQLCKTYNTDAVLSLDHFKTRIITKYDRHSFFNPVENDYYSAYVAGMKIEYEALFRVYDPSLEKIVSNEFLRDTLVWEDADVSTRELFTRFTSVKQALTEAGIDIALNFSDKISTQWKEERRKYFMKGSADFEQAGQIANSGNWETAIAMWKDIEEKSGSKSVKSKAQLNIAVGYEMLGNLNEAVSWAVKSYETMYRQVTYQYLQIL
ncbi:MAG TPA: DUF6340 family protein, partial [Draconibacterium sp.]|nr:DUF6340 family protein [Draconibacterium sp.]